MFGRRREDKLARDATAKAEMDRLAALSPEALALELLPVLGSPTIMSKLGGVPDAELCKRLLGGFGGSLSVNTFGLRLPVREALQRLEHADLVMQMASGVDQSLRWRITSAGRTSLADGSAVTKLGTTPA